MNNTETTETTATYNQGVVALFGEVVGAGKIHRTTASNTAICLNDNGFSEISSVWTKVPVADFMWTEATPAERQAWQASTTANEIAALTAAGANMDDLCKKCCKKIIKAQA
jgi:hypothetical protein